MTDCLNPDPKASQFPPRRNMLCDKIYYSRIWPGEFNYFTNISLKNQYVYFEIAKAGCTSVKKLLGLIEFQDEGLGPDIPAAFLENPHCNVIGTPFVKPFQLSSAVLAGILSPDTSFKLFTVCRNPYARALSAYLDKIKYLTPECSTLLPFTDKPISEWSFLDFLQAIRRACVEHPPSVDKHWRPQAWNIGEIVEYKAFTYFQLEQGAWQENMLRHVESDYIDDLSSLDASSPLGMHHARHAAGQLCHFYTPDCILAAQDIYEEDFLCFSYDTECSGL